MNTPSAEDGAGPEQDLISQEDMARVAKGARQIASYANFLRWTANFRRDEVIKHPSHDKVFNLSPMQSGRFSYSVEGNAIFLGVQKFEAAWMASMPFDAVYVSDRLYLSVDGASCMDARLPALAVGIFIDEQRKLDRLKVADCLQLIEVHVTDGVVVEVGNPLGDPIPLLEGDIVKKMFETQQEKTRLQDMSRFF